MARTYESVFNTSARNQSAIADTSVSRHVSTTRHTVAPRLPFTATDATTGFGAARGPARPGPDGLAFSPCPRP